MTGFGDLKPEISIDFGYFSIYERLNVMLSRVKHKKVE